MNIASVFDNLATHHAARIAVSDSNRNFTFADVQRRSHELAGAMARHGIGPGSRVVLLSANRAETPEIMYATARVGAVFVPVNSRYDERDLTGIIAAATPNLLIVDPGLRPLVDRLREQVAGDVVFFDTNGGYETYRADVHDEVPVPAEVADEPFLLAFTSGSTGSPKGLMFDQRSILTLALAWSLEYRFNSSTRFLVCLPHPTSGALAQHLVGGSVVMFDSRSFTGEGFCRLVDALAITDTYVVPTQLYRILEHLDSATTELASLRTVGYGAAAIAPARLAALVERLGARFQQLYGMKEVGGLATQLRPEDHAAAISRPHLFASAGRASYLTQVRILDGDSNVLPVRDVGQIALRTPYQMLEYFKQPELTAATLVDGYVCTGDIGYVDEEGYLYVVGRSKDIIVRGGQNVAPREVEDLLARHPQIDEIAVVGVPDREWGETVVGVAVARGSAAIEEQELQEWCRGEGLSSIKIPSTFRFVPELPKNALGKVDKRRVSEWLSTGL